jgi:hypothetical protein
MFKPTHLLVSRSKQIPVHLVAGRAGFFLVTESEWHQNRKPAFEMHSQRGFLCQGIPVLGYSLQPLAIKTSQAPSMLK